MQLKRSLKLWHVVFIGIGYMAPMAVFDTFGIVSQITNGHVPAAYLLTLLAILLTASSYGKMVRVYPPLFNIGLIGAISLLAMFLDLITPVLGGSFVLFLWFHLESMSLYIGASWAIIGVFYLGFKTKMFKQPLVFSFNENEAQ